MCSRYSLTSPPEAVRAFFGYRDTPNLPPRYNIAPTQPVAVVRLNRDEERQFRLMRWGLLPPFVKDLKQFPTLINARAEEVLDKPSFRHAMRYRRCLVPADGFYEWTGPKGKRRPFLLCPRQPQLIAFAGIYERQRDQEGDEIDTVAILTCAANRMVAALHDRMPVVLSVGHFEAWLDVNRTTPEAALALLQPAPEDLFEAIEMQPKINGSKRDEPGIQEPLEPSLL
jgi:putative SOS response-associated peptidase YedK